MSSLFSEQILADKLSKLSSTQQCIETLSHWCIFHQGKAEVVVTIWDKQFHNSELVQKVPLLYLANDILQNSKRKGNEFVIEFWKVLPAALKDVFAKGDEHGKSVVSRLVNIWEERRVFGSRAKSLKDVMLGEKSPPPLEFSNNRKRSCSVRIVKRDSRSIRTKLTIGGIAEKIVSAFHVVLSEHSSEDEEMNKCKSSVHRVRKVEKDVDLALTSAKDPKRKVLAKQLEDEENILRQCIDKLKVVESNRVALVSQLQEALHEQESELENVRTQMLVAEAEAEEASNMRKWLHDENYVADSKPSTATTPPMEDDARDGQSSKKTAAAIAAELADKLTASSSSQYIMTSVLSTFAAEEAKNAGLTKSSAMSNSVTSAPVNSAYSSISKTQQSLSGSDQNALFQAQTPDAAQNNHYQSFLVHQPPMQSQMPNSQPPYNTLANTHNQQYLQPSSGHACSYGYGSIPPIAPPPPPPPYMVSPMVPLTQPQLQIPKLLGHQPSPLTQQPPVPPSFWPLVHMPPGVVYYTRPPNSQ